MAKEAKQMYQCRLQQVAYPTLTTVGWIEKRGAKVGRTVELMPTKELWKVIAVFDHPLPEDMLKFHQQINRHSLPSVDPIA
jgi:hypothetical protein